MGRPRAGTPERSGLTFLELATVLVVVGVLTALGHGAVREAKKNAYRVRARSALAQVYRSEVLHSAVHGRFTDQFEQLRSMGLPEELDPLYRFGLVTPAPSSFVCEAWANLDPDLAVDSLAVDETGIVRALARD
jgi:Tfp pilus assembly protein PilE